MVLSLHPVPAARMPRPPTSLRQATRCSGNQPMTSQRIPLGLVLAGLACAAGWQTLRAQPVAPPPPKEYEVQVRYRILAARNERLAKFNAMVGYLETVGFKKDAGPEDEAENASYNRMSGTIASANVRKLIIEPHVKSVLLLPAGYKLPAETELVKAQLELATGLAPDRQHLLAVQTLDKLKQFGFREAIGYDHRGYTRLVGRIPASELETLLKDLRMQPSGWLVPVTPVAELPLPLRNVSPILITEVIPEPQGVPPAKEPSASREPPPEQAHLRKLAQDLQALLSTEGGGAQTIRMEVILSSTPGPDERGWLRLLATTVDGMRIEGRLGPLVTVR